ncbi:hypothetical protein [Synechococcus elongatus]|uniref:hypothetical protein n=1 Tax=Synechococcus elongatus TaxID=32046 RepID=UPI000F7DFD1B|nr:hypothetical protein [Synechococcus elongatus]
MTDQTLITVESGLIKTVYYVKFFNYRFKGTPEFFDVNNAIHYASKEIEATDYVDLVRSVTGQVGESRWLDEIRTLATLITELPPEAKIALSDKLRDHAFRAINDEPDEK